jgi:hypothetical protein
LEELRDALLLLPLRRRRRRRIGSGRIAFLC